MTLGWALASILIPTVVCGIAALFLCLADRCDHTLFPQIHIGSSRIYYACRCGRYFDASPSGSSGSSPSSSPSTGSSPWSTR